MAAEPTPQQKQDGEAIFWWGSSLGFSLVLLNAALLELLTMKPYHEDRIMIFLQYLLFLFLLFFFCGMWRGRITRKMSAAAQIGALGCCISALSLLVLPFIMYPGGLFEGLNTLISVFGEDEWLFLVMLSIMVAGIAGGVSGGLIGSRLLHLRISSD